MTETDLRPAAGDLPRPDPLRPAETALFLDLDGTLAAIEARPEHVVAHAGRTSLLARLGAALDGRLAVISGRSLDDLDRILDGSVIAAAGVHGLQRRRGDGVLTAAPAVAEIAGARRALARSLPHAKGLIVEDKGLALAVHFRQAPSLAGAVAQTAQAVAARYGLAVQPGDMVVELRPPGFDKGDAIEAFMTEPPFAGFTPVFVGDDLTDENGFRAAAAFGGYGVLVGPTRKTLASRGLAGVDEVMAWLERATQA